jgi:Na+/H+ antiporter NhaD/arsenite permease-like protein
MIALAASALFVFGYILITLESKLRVHKSAVALAVGSVSWILLGAFDPGLAHLEFVAVSSDIFNLIVFLIAAMSLVEIAGHYRAFDLIKAKLDSYSLSDRAQFTVLCFMTFFMSAVLNDLTTTIVMVQIARKFFSGRNLAVSAVGVVIAANAGGSWSPIGAVTTIMLWLADKFTAMQIVSFAFLPAFMLLVVAIAMLRRKIIDEPRFVTGEMPEGIKLTRSEKMVLSLVAVSFLMPVAMKSIGLSPVIGALFGLGITWMAIDLFKRFKPCDTHLSATIEHFLQKADLSSIKFFVGILLSVSALATLGVLDRVSTFIYGGGESIVRVALGNGVLGFASAVLDNIALTAIAIKMVPSTDPNLWALLAVAVATGGSMLAIGSAAGVVASGMVRELTFGTYFKIAFVPALVGLLTACAVWTLQYLAFVPSV